MELGKVSVCILSIGVSILHSFVDAFEEETFARILPNIAVLLVLDVLSSIDNIIRPREDTCLITSQVEVRIAKFSI